MGNTIYLTIKGNLTSNIIRLDTVHLRVLILN